MIQSFILKEVDWIELHWIFFLRKLTSSVLFSSLVHLCTITSKTLSWNSPNMRRWSRQAVACPSCKSWLWRSPQNSSKQTMCAYRNIMNRIVTAKWQKKVIYTSWNTLGVLIGQNTRGSKAPSDWSKKLRHHTLACSDWSTNSLFYLPPKREMKTVFDQNGVPPL